MYRIILYVRQNYILLAVECSPPQAHNFMKWKDVANGSSVRQQLDSAYEGHHNKPSSIPDRSSWTLTRAEAEEWRRSTIL